MEAALPGVTLRATCGHPFCACLHLDTQHEHTVPIDIGDVLWFVAYDDVKGMLLHLWKRLVSRERRVSCDTSSAALSSCGPRTTHPAVTFVAAVVTES